MRSCNAAGARSRRPMKRVRTPWRTRSGSSRSIVSVKISISSSTSAGGRFQFSVENAYTAKRVDAEVDRRFDRAAQRLRAGPVTGGDRQPALACPARVAVHDDRDGVRDIRQVGLGRGPDVPQRSDLREDAHRTSRRLVPHGH